MVGGAEDHFQDGGSQCMNFGWGAPVDGNNSGLDAV